MFLTALSVLVFEIALMRWFSVVARPGFSFLGISVVLFGLASGGIFVYLFADLFKEEKWKSIFLPAAFCYGLSPFLFVVLQEVLDVPLAQPYMLNLVLFLILLSIPFGLINICFSVIFSRKGRDMDVIYFADLVGAGLGVAIAVVLMNYFSVFGVILITSAFGLIGASFWAWWLGTKKIFIFGMVAAAIVAGLAIVDNNDRIFDLKYSKKGPEENIVFSKWNSFSRVTVFKESKSGQLPSLPDNLSSVLPEQYGIEIDSDAYTSVINFSGELNKVNFLKRDLSSAAYLVSEPGRALVIGSGGGRDVLAGLVFGNKVTAVEVNPIIADDIMQGFLKSFNGDLYNHPDVELKITEGRGFLKKDSSKYDVIALPLVDTWASTVGGHFATVENYLYTVESFQDYFDHLSDDGILTVSRWEYDGLRLMYLFLEMAGRAGIDAPESQVMVIQAKKPGYLVLNNYLFKESPFTKKEIEVLKRFSAQNGFSVTYSPGQELPKTRGSIDTLAGGEAKYLELPVDLRPSTDDNPFFFFNVPREQMARLIFSFNCCKLDGGLGAALRAILIMVALSFVIPFLVRKLPPTKGEIRALPLLGYFSVLGLAFIFIEIALMQKFILYLEQPIFSYSVILSSALVAAGIGSLSSRLLDHRKNSVFGLVSLGILGLMPFELYLIDRVVPLTMGEDIFYKILSSVLLISPGLFLMGMMMPLAIKRLEDIGGAGYIPWGWGMNGAFSVLGTGLAIFFAILFGFKFVLLLGASLYPAAVLLLYFSFRHSGFAKSGDKCEN